MNDSTEEQESDEQENFEFSDTEMSNAFLGEITQEFIHEGSYMYDFKKAEEPAKVEAEGVVTEHHLKEIIRELGLIKLCWSEVPKVDFEERVHFPTSYKENNRKEKLLLWYAENFRKQFHYNYPDRRPLMLARNNECDVQKMVSTTIRPTNMKYPEFQSWQGCASFVADHLHYEELENPTILAVTEMFGFFEAQLADFK